MKTECSIHLMADRTTHMRYLESQLERMQSCCIKVNVVGKDVEDLRNGLIVMQDKVVNLAKLLDHEHHSVDAAIQDCKAKMNDLANQQLTVHDLLCGQASKESPVGLMSGASRAFLSKAFDQWRAKQSTIFTAGIDDVKETVQKAIAHVKNDLESLAHRHTAVETSITRRLADVEANSQKTESNVKTRSQTREVSQDRLCKKLMSMIQENYNGISGAVESVASEMEQIKKQSTAELSDIRASMQYLQQQYGDIQQRMGCLEAPMRCQRQTIFCGALVDAMCSTH
eukprot:jgi/Ulvmu1/1511/UM011_0241.1